MCVCGRETAEQLVAADTFDCLASSYRAAGELVGLRESLSVFGALEYLTEHSVENWVELSFLST